MLPVGLVHDPAGRVVLDPDTGSGTPSPGLVAVTGTREGEAVRLDRDDVDLEQGLLTIRNSKFGKSRQLPVHQSTVIALAGYGRRRDARRPAKPLHGQQRKLFHLNAGTRLLRDNVSTVFPRLVREAGFDRSGRRAPS